MPLMAVDDEAVVHDRILRGNGNIESAESDDTGVEADSGVEYTGGSSIGDFARMRELEARAGVFNGDALLAERLALTVKLAPLDAIVGPAGVGEAQLKSMLFGVAAEHRHRFAEEGKKVTETAIEEAARSDARYVAKIDEMAGIRAEYVVLRAMVDNLTSRLQWAMAVMRYEANAPRNV